MLNTLKDISMNFTAYLFDIERRIRNNVDGRGVGIFYSTLLEVLKKHTKTSFKIAGILSRNLAN